MILRNDLLSPARHSQIGNDYRNWTSSAQVLLTASSVLARERNEERARVLNTTNATPVSAVLLTLSAELVLTAFAVETLLKALWLRKGNSLVRQGKYKCLPCERRRRSHDLVAICDNVDFEVTKRECGVLDILSSAGRFKGRYPIARPFGEMGSVFLWSDDYDKVTEKLVARLWNALEKKQ